MLQSLIVFIKLICLILLYVVPIVCSSQSFSNGVVSLCINASWAMIPSICSLVPTPLANRNKTCRVTSSILRSGLCYHNDRESSTMVSGLNILQPSLRLDLFVDVNLKKLLQSNQLMTSRTHDLRLIWTVTTT